MSYYQQFVTSHLLAFKTVYARLMALTRPTTNQLESFASSAGHLEINKTISLIFKSFYHSRSLFHFLLRVHTILKRRFLRRRFLRRFRWASLIVTLGNTICITIGIPISNPTNDRDWWCECWVRKDSEIVNIRMDQQPFSKVLPGMGCLVVQIVDSAM